jgi:hypothetical protein
MKAEEAESDSQEVGEVGGCFLLVFFSARACCVGLGRHGRPSASRAEHTSKHGGSMAAHGGQCMAVNGSQCTIKRLAGRHAAKKRFSSLRHGSLVQQSA